MCKNKLHRWITTGTPYPFYAKKTFILEDVPENATAFVCGLGQFNFYVNGRRVGDHVLDPAWSDYRKTIYYVRFDITDYLKEGENLFLAEVGNGWYSADQAGGYFFHFPSFMPPNPNGYRPFDSKLVFSLEAELVFPDGSVKNIETDESWQVADHKVLHSNCYGSEMVDGGRKNPVWRAAGIADNSEKLSSLAEEQMMPPVRVIHTYEGRYMKTVNGRAIYDFGQNCSGMLSFKVRGKAGAVIHARPAEKLKADGDVDQMAKNWLPVDVCETYIIGEDETWEKFEMTFTYIGGRYVSIDADRADLRNVRLSAISSAAEKAGGFDCDDKRFLQIYDLVEKAVEANLVSVHTDCPTIERFAWQEENHLMAPAIMYMKKVKPHWEKFLKDTRESQLTKEDYFSDGKGGRYYPGEGLIPSQAPCYIPNVLPTPGMGDFYNVIGWGSSIILGTYWHYQFYGDKKIIEESYGAGKKYLDFLKSQVNKDGFINNGLGDWGNPEHEYAKENIETAFLFADAKVLAEFAEILGRDQDAAAMASYAERIRENYNKKLLAKNPENGRWGYRVWGKEGYVMTQAAEAMPLFWKITPEEYENDVAENLRETVQSKKALCAGEVGLPYIIQAMSRHGMNDLLCEMILKPEHPGYYAFVLNGETTLGEYWEDNPRSHDHDMMGHIIEWYYNGIAGIRPLEPGFKKVLVRPYLPASMNHMKCRYESAAGPISVEMKRRGDGIQLEASVPDGVDIIVDRSQLR